MFTPFVHLRLHTEYSIEDSIIQINDLLATAKLQKVPALALTDKMNLFAGIKFYKAMSAAGIKPILGIDAYLEHTLPPGVPLPCTLLCQTQQGYYHLLELVSEAYKARLYHKEPVIKKEWLQEKAEGLIVLSGGMNGEVGQALLNNRKEEATDCLKAWNSLFPGRFYIELQRMGRPHEERYIRAVSALASIYQIPVVATHDIRFLNSDDFEAHEARLCIQQGYTLSDSRRPKRYTAEQYFKSAYEMQRLFSDIPSALVNSVEIAKRCNVTVDMKSVHLPHFSTPNDVTVNDYLVDEAQKGLAIRLLGIKKTIQSSESHQATAETTSDLYYKRLSLELEVINKMGFAGYFLIVAGFIRWAKKERIPVGPGRGSGAGSLVAYALQITEVDPIRYGLLFERFLNAERVSLPDFDIDFCMEHRDRVIDYVMHQYGLDAVAQIVTFGTMAARAVIRDVGRVLAYPYGMVDGIAKLVPFEVGMTLAVALKRDEKSPYSLKARYQKEEEVRLLIDLAQKLEGLVRNVGTHAGGVVIAPQHLTRFTALYYESEGKNAVTQLDKDDLEAIGLVKFDFLGLRTLTIIDWAVNTINRKRIEQGEALLDVAHLALDDKATFTLLQSARVTGIFQLESRGIRALLKRLVPDHFDDIVALIALFRPGPLQSGMVDDFIQRKHDASQVRYLHPSLEPILSSTYGVILYQEQVMQIAQVLANYSLGAADLLRRAMSKKKPAEMAKQRAFFIQGSEKKGIDKVFANTMFDLIEKFAGYGFNKSHSVAYAFLSYQTAWLKTHYPAEFMAAVLSSEIEHTEKLSALLYECHALGLKIKTPHIHTSQYMFVMNDAGEIEYGLGAIKGIGRTAVEHLLSVQKNVGTFKDLFELCAYIESDKVNRRALEALICSGCFDVFGKSRAELLSQLAAAMQAAVHKTNALLSKQSDLFGQNIPEAVVTPNQAAVSAWTIREKLKKEKEVLGIYLSDHPIERYKDELKSLRLVDLDAVYKTVRSSFLVGAWLVDTRVRFTANGDRFAILLLENARTRLELRISQEQYQTYREKLVKHIFFVVEVERYTDSARKELRLLVRQLWDIVDVREKWGRVLYLRLKAAYLDQIKNCLVRLQSTLSSAKGEHLRVMVEYETKGVRVPLSLGDSWRVQPTDQLLEALQELVGVGNVFVSFK